MVFMRLIRSLDRRRFAPLLALMNATGPLLDGLPPDCSVYDLRKGSRAGFPKAALRYRALERQLSPQAVVSGLPNANMLCCLARIGVRPRCPLIVTEHVSQSGYADDPKHRLVPYGIKWLYRKAARVVAVSDGLKEELIDVYGVPPQKVLRIFNPVDIAEVRRAAAEPLPAALPPGPIIVSVGRLAPQKAPGDLLAAFGLLKPDLGAHLIFVGDGPLRSDLETAVAQRGLGDRVLFVGSDSNPFRWMARAGVFVSASVFEGFALTIAEAMAVGTPVVATDCPHGPRELLRDGWCGDLVPVGRPELLARGIERMLTNANHARQMTSRAGDRVTEFDEANVVSQYEMLIDEVCAT